MHSIFLSSYSYFPILDCTYGNLSSQAKEFLFVSPRKIMKLCLNTKKGYKALNQLFVDALMKKQDKHQVDIAIGRL